MLARLLDLLTALVVLWTFFWCAVFLGIVTVAAYTGWKYRTRRLTDS